MKFSAEVERLRSEAKALAGAIQARRPWSRSLAVVWLVAAVCRGRLGCVLALVALGATGVQARERLLSKEVPA
jgi:hypothetical protein